MIRVNAPRVVIIVRNATLLSVDAATVTTVDRHLEIAMALFVAVRPLAAGLDQEIDLHLGVADLVLAVVRRVLVQHVGVARAVALVENGGDAAENAGVEGRVGIVVQGSLERDLTFRPAS